MERWRSAARLTGLASLAAVVLLASTTGGRAAPPDAAHRERYEPSADPVASAEAYRHFLEDGAGDAAMDLLTRASRVLWKRRPLPADEIRRRAAELAAAGPLRARLWHEWAVVAPADGRKGVRPVLLERENGTWRVDQVEMEKALGLDPAGVVLQLDDDTPYAFGIEGRSAALFADLGSADLFGEDPAEAIARLESAPKTAKTELRLAEILLRNCWLADEALPHYEAALRLAPTDWAVARTFGLRALFLGIGDRALPVLEAFGPRAGELIGRIHVQARRFDQGQDAAIAGLLYRWRSPPPAPAAPTDAGKSSI